MGNRIQLLDSFRALAIIAVLFYHFYSRWTIPLHHASLYDYGDTFAAYFKYGYLGVHFFFIISGFVIFYTLEKTENIIRFWQNRKSRLLPAMAVASIITYVFAKNYDPNYLFFYSHEFKNFLPSITFISPGFFNKFPEIFTHNYYYINMSYWSLWPEIQFYLVSSLLYFLSKKHFFRNFMVFSILVSCFHILIQGNYFDTLNAIKPFYYSWFEQVFNLPFYLPFFALGIVFYSLFKENLLQYETIKSSKSYLLTLCILVVISILYMADLSLKGIVLSMVILFLIMIYKPNLLSFLESKLLFKIGFSSYFLYLIHEVIGVVVIERVSKLMPFSFLLPIIIMAILVYLSILFTTKIEVKLVKFLKHSIFRVPLYKNH